MSVKRSKTFDGLFTSERVTFDLTQPMDEETWAEFCRVGESTSIVGLIGRYEEYIAAHSGPMPDVAIRLDKMRSALAVAKRGGPRDTVLMAMENAELWRREIEALPHAVLGAETKGRLQNLLPEAIKQRKEQAKRERDRKNLYKADLQKEADKLRGEYSERSVSAIRTMIKDRHGATKAQLRALKIARRRTKVP